MALSRLVDGQANCEVLISSCPSLQVHCRFPWGPEAAIWGTVPPLSLP